MVKSFIISFFLFFSCLVGQSGNNINDSCGSLIVKKARESGYRSLNLSEKMEYYLDLRKCKNKDLVKAVKKEVNQNQLISDSENAKTFVGKTSTFTYCIVLFIAYLSSFLLFHVKTLILLKKKNL